MNTETIHILIAACTLIAAGIASFPYRLSYGNTSWLPWWMQPDCYPARNINLLFSVSVMVIGILAMLFILTPDLPDDVPAERWFAALAVLYPAYASCQVLFWRKDYGDGFCYAGRITSFSYGKVYTILLTAATTFALYLTNVGFCLLCCLFLIHDYIRVFRLRGDNEYSDPIGIKEMYPESLGLLAFPPLAVLSEGALWWNPSICTIVFAVLLSVNTVLRYLFRFHPAIKGDEHERRGYLRYWRRHNFEDEII